MTVSGQDVCKYCRSDIKKMSLLLDLDSLTVYEISTGKSYNFYKTTNDFYIISDGGKKW